MRLASADTAAVHVVATGVLVGALGAAVVAPDTVWLLLAGAFAASITFLAFRHTTAFCAAWLLITSMTLEMAAFDLFGPAYFQGTIAGLKAAQIALAAICALRWGARLDLLNPAWAFVAMATIGMAHGLYPGLVVSDTIRSLVGSVAPFAFCFVRVPLSWSEAMLRAVRWAPMVALVAGMLASLAGIRPLFVEGGGWRLTGLGHPAFFAGICLTALYACLIALYRRGRMVDLGLLAANGLLLLLTGARAPLAYGVAVTLLSLVFVRSPAIPFRFRLLLILAVAAALPALVVLADELAFVRVFHQLNTDAVNLSGRDLLWPEFQAVAAQSPWVGWGVGAANMVIPPDSPVAQLLHTWAAHNEYLRIRVEGGYVGLGLLVTLFALWVWRRTARIRRSDALIMRFVFAAFACHALTDNLLISTPACVLFTFAAAVFARGAQEPGQRPRSGLRGAVGVSASR